MKTRIRFQTKYQARQNDITANPQRNHPGRKSHGLVGSALAGLGLLCVATGASGQGVPLGAARNFTVASYAGVTNSGPSIVTGNLALSPLTTTTGFSFSTPAGLGIVTGAVHSNDGLAIQAQADAMTAYNTLAGQAYLPANDKTGTDLGGLTLTPGVYHFNSSAGLTGTLTLNTLGDPNAVFIFQVGSSLTTATGSSIVVTGGGTPKVYWQVGSAATLNSNTAFAGNILALNGVTMGTSANLVNGRAISLGGPVTLLSNTLAAPALNPAAPERYWNGSLSNLWSANNFSSTVAGLDQVALGTGADVVFSVTSAPLHQTTSLDSNATISSLSINDPAGVSIAGPNTLTLASTGLVTGINVNSGAGLTTIGSKLVLGSMSQIVTVNNAAGLLISGAVGGSNGLTKAGSGVLTLTGAETYSGATVVSSGTLQLGDGVTAGTSIAASNSVLVASGAALALNLKSGETFANSVTNNGQINWIQAGTNSQASTSVVSGTGSSLITGAGTTILLGSNSYSGGTTVTTSGVVLAGNLSANTSSAFGNGVLTINNGYVDTYNSQLLQVNVGGYVQSGGEIGIHLEGTTAANYTHYNVAGTSHLSGGSVFVYDLSGNYVPYGGDVQTIIHTSGGLTGQFASNAPFSTIYNAPFNADFHYHQGATLLYPTVTYTPANANITWVQDSFTSVAGLTPNQTAVGTALDHYQANNPVDAGGVITFLDGQPVASLPDLYNSLMPSDLTAIFQIGFSGADIQNANIERHLELARQAPETYSQRPTIHSKDSKGGTVESSPGIAQSSTPWNFFLEGSGEFVRVHGNNDAFGCDFTTERVTLGGDLRMNDNLIVGLMGSFGNSNADLANGGSIHMTGGKAAAYASLFGNGFYLDGLVGAGLNSYDTTRSVLFGFADGSAKSWELDTLLNGGYDIHQGDWTYGLTASLAYTRVELDSFTESGSLAPLSYPNQSQESLRTNLGTRIAYTALMNGIKITPQVRLSWQHECLDSTQSMQSQFAYGNSPSFTVDGPRMGRDSALVSAGLSMQITPTLNLYAYYDGQLGRSNYVSNTVSCGLKYDF